MEEKQSAMQADTINSTTTTSNATTQIMTPATDISAVFAVEPFDQEVTGQIIRQVEYYFSDQNLPSDSHLLGLTGGNGNGPVSIKQIYRWRKMRQYKPLTAVKEVLKQSAVLDMNDGEIKRRFPLTLKPVVRPEIDIEHEHYAKTLANNPHLTKNMLKPTGFEEYYADTPVTPQQYEKDRRLYNPDSSFETRIENAIRHYRVKRKMHQGTLRVFDLWMKFGGIDTSPNAFLGGVDQDEEEHDKDEAAARRFTYTVDEHILDNEEKYKIDFKTVALAFLSTEFPFKFNHTSPSDVHNACNVMINFINYLLHHDVCPEYRVNLLEARSAIALAESEMNELPSADKSLQSYPSFDAACSHLHTGKDRKELDWHSMYQDVVNTEDAEILFKIGLLAFGNAEQKNDFERRLKWRDEDLQIIKLTDSMLLNDQEPVASTKHVVKVESHNTTLHTSTDSELNLSFSYHNDCNLPANITTNDTASEASTIIDEPNNDAFQSPYTVKVSEVIGLEISAVEYASKETTELFDTLADTIVPRMGLLQCRQWKMPNTTAMDLSEDRSRLPNQFDFIVNEAALDACRVGMKLDANVKQLDNGICWLERVNQVMPKFYTRIPSFKSARQRRREIADINKLNAKRARRESKLGLVGVSNTPVEC